LNDRLGPLIKDRQASDEPGGAPDPRLFVAALEKGLTVLRAFYDQPHALSLTEIAERTGLGRSAVQRFLYTLRMLGYLRQEPRTRRYVLSPRVLDFGYAYLRNDSLVETSFPYLLEASKRSRETVNLTELDDTDVIYVSRFPSRNVISVDILLGARLPAFSTAPGRAMLAFMPTSEAQAVLARSALRPLTPYTLTDQKRIVAALAEIRTRGYALSDQETYLGDLSTAAPVRDHDGRVRAAVNIAVPTPRWSLAQMEQELTPIVVETARAISKALGAY
jgi:IclR family pca regulon transcriptional regulator